ncbi:MAG: PLDc N-terminal domain-containing protein [Eubacteriales bacterium]|nr:PLDc N-terminal domain-containing protein [Eubacteriales bacterium]
MPDIKEILPFILPLLLEELALLIYTIRHILTHSTYKRGSRALWLIVVIVGMEFIGPILYFLLGKEDE